jgi:3-hydroxyisobutyrate dehydrogenase
MMPLDSVLFIGAGTMGAPMARRLLAASVPLAVADPNPAAREAFEALGVPVAASGDQLAGDVVITMVPTGAHVRAALLGPGGALARPRRAVIDMSSSAPTPTVALARELGQRGLPMLDAPVSGGRAKALTGELTTMVGGDPAVLERYRTLLGCMCTTILHVGPSGAGDTMKALNNYLSGIALLATCEALVVGAKAGLDPAVMIAAWQKSTGRNHTTEFKAPRSILPRTFDAGFASGLIAKDVGIAAGLAEELGVAAPLLDATRARWDAVRDALGADADWTRALTLVERDANFTLEAVPKEL